MLKTLMECQMKCQTESLKKINQIPAKHMGELMKIGGVDVALDIAHGDFANGLKKGTVLVNKPEFKRIIIRMIREYMNIMKNIKPHKQADCIIKNCDPESIGYMVDIITFFTSVSKIMMDKDVIKSLNELDKMMTQNLDVVEKEIIPRYKTASKKKDKETSGKAPGVSK